MNKIETLYLIAKCLTINERDGFRDEFIQLESDELIDWTLFFGIASNNLVLPALYVRFAQCNLLTYLPEAVAEYLYEIYSQNKIRNKQILKQIDEINELLNYENIYPIYLKGAAHLLDGLYADCGERMLGDIDLLIDERNLLKAAKTLENNGYRIHSEYFVEVDHNKHFPALVKDCWPAHIELHRTAVSDDYLNELSYEKIEKEKRRPEKGTGCYIFSDKHSIIHNFIHSQLEHEGFVYGMSSLRDLYDLHLLIKKCDSNHLLPEIKERKRARLYFLYASELFGNNLNHEEKGIFYSFHLKRFKLNYQSHVYFVMHRSAVYIVRRLWLSYIRQFFMVFFSPKTRKSVFRRLKNPHWYLAHLKSYRNIFP
jgi:hypothetical protein